MRESILKKTTIKDVAKASGMSIATVSQILNSRGHFTHKTIEKVRQIAESLGYIPDKNAKQLRTGSSILITVILPNLTNPFFSALVQSMQEYLEKSHFDNIDLTFQTSSFLKIDETIDNLIQRGTDGLIITEPLPNPIRTNDLLKRHHIPYVVLDRNSDYNLTDSVSTNEFEGGKLAAKYFQSLGHQHVGIITPNYTSPSINARIDGFLSLWSANSTDRPQKFITDFTKDGGREISPYIAQSDITGVFSLNDDVAIGLIRGLADQGVSVPQDLSIIGFDNIEYASYTVPSLTTIAQPVPEMGSKAISILIERLNNEQSDQASEFNSVIFENELIIRDSTQKA
nr:LacI family DNA-binding transcriptional regulator [Secundilactobacillus kimchicus]